MNIKKVLKAAEVAIGTGLYLLDQSDQARRTVRERLNDQVDDLRDRAKDAYEAAADRISDVSSTLRNNGANNAAWNVLRFAVGLGIGIGVGLLVAPANGEHTRAKLAEKAQEIGGNVKQRFASHDLRATGTGD